MGLVIIGEEIGLRVNRLAGTLRWRDAKDLVRAGVGRFDIRGGDPL